MSKRISYHDVAWDRRRLAGAIRLTFDDRSQSDLRALSMAELALICNLLRSEKPVYYDDETERFTTDAAYSNVTSNGD